ncbi:MAG: hypothetical protein U9N30_06145 [Campylobacterota bacterium]|nr:hypothetical protein [Campylobacterota bacterium]
MENELYEKVEEAFVEESRLVERLNTFMHEYNDFEYDEMGMNMEEADEVKARLNKIHDKLLNNVNEHLDFPLDSMHIDIVFHTVELLAQTTKEIEKEGGEIQIEQISVPFSMIIDDDGFSLQINEIQASAKEVQNKEDNYDEDEKDESIPTQTTTVS